MSNNQDNAPASATDYTPMAELASYHEQIAEKYKNTNPVEVEANTDAQALMAFNGYYALGNAKGAFFTVDTNIHIQSGAQSPIYDIALLVSLDGTTSERFSFTGTFDGTTLVQQTEALEGLDANLTFTHTDGSDGTTASVSGTISLPGKSAVSISGVTYNNPIPYSVYIGKYYTSPGRGNKNPLLVMQIKDNYQLFYDNGQNNGTLQPISSFTYNLNMYFFSFTQGQDSVRLIMGTAAAGGLACNNMIVDGQNVISRSLQTIPAPDMASDTPTYNLVASAELAAFSGYYLLPSVGSGAFISIQAQYVNEIGDDYVVMIGVSSDGVNSKGYYFDSSMSFTNNTLSMPQQNISLKFTRGYNSANKSLVTITGTILGHANTNGYTPFNPVPLSGFGGGPMKNTKGMKLTVVSDNEVVYEGTQITTDMKKILYVPIMYILAYPAENSTTVMSFGTDGLKGNACIITDNNGIYVVTAIQ